MMTPMNRFFKPPRMILLCAALLSPALTQAATTRTEHTTYADSMRWQQDDRELQLRGSDGGVVVDMARPGRLFGLTSGDVIQRIDDVRVTTVTSLLDALLARRGRSVVFAVLRQGMMRQVHVSAQDYADWIPSEPPPPPAPPQPATSR